MRWIHPTRPRVSDLVPALLLVALLAPAATAAAQTEHPRLVSVEASRCGLCHGALTEDKPQVHAPVAEDCTYCHELSLGADSTTVALMAPEPELCLLCHGEMEAAAAGEVASPHAPVTDSCLNCHAPHAATEPALLLEPVGELCTTCHDRDELQPVHGEQLTAASDCTACHLPHGSATAPLLAGGHVHAPFESGSCEGCHRKPFGDRVRLRARGNRLCEACHGDVAEPSAGGSVHPALDDRRGDGCRACHQPHMSDQPALLRWETVDTCATCHPDVVAAARADSGHVPAADDCTTCHLPHSASEPHLLAAPVGELCGWCHDLEDEELAATHLGADLTGLDCTGCHTPHGSGNPSLLAAVIHPVVLDGCDLCHAGSSDQLNLEGSELCTACHSDIAEAAAEHTVPHMAMEMADCYDCHNPHASKQEHLVRAVAGGECRDCHDEPFAEGGEVAHGVIEAVGCRACHEPHGSSRATLLRAEGAELCLACHGSPAPEVAADAETALLFGRFPVAAEMVRNLARVQLSADGQHGHPVLGHRVLGEPTADELRRTETTFRGELTCLTCHNPHKGASRQLLAGGAASASETCLRCHPK